MDNEFQPLTNEDVSKILPPGFISFQSLDSKGGVKVPGRIRIVKADSIQSMLVDFDGALEISVRKKKGDVKIKVFDGKKFLSDFVFYVR